jgi:hypothetical protein
MKKILHNLVIIISLFTALLITSTTLNAQTFDTTLFDYDLYSGCEACGDDITYGTETYDSIEDATSPGIYIADLKIKVKLFSCYSGSLDLYLNGNLVGTKTATYNCSCNACDSLIYNVSALDISNYYKYG